MNTDQNEIPEIPKARESPKEPLDMPDTKQGMTYVQKEMKVLDRMTSELQRHRLNEILTAGRKAYFDAQSGEEKNNAWKQFIADIDSFRRKYFTLPPIDTIPTHLTSRITGAMGRDDDAEVLVKIFTDELKNQNASPYYNIFIEEAANFTCAADLGVFIEQGQNENWRKIEDLCGGVNGLWSAGLLCGMKTVYDILNLPASIFADCIKFGEGTASAVTELNEKDVNALKVLAGVGADVFRALTIILPFLKTFSFISSLKNLALKNPKLSKTIYILYELLDSIDDARVNLKKAGIEV